jgi:hypothetical protein
MYQRASADNLSLRISAEAGLIDPAAESRLRDFLPNFRALLFLRMRTEVKQNSDSDSDDDDVDAYEWGINSAQPHRVVSICTARWRGENISGSVEAGP